MRTRSADRDIRNAVGLAVAAGREKRMTSNPLVEPPAPDNLSDGMSGRQVLIAIALGLVTIVSVCVVVALTTKPRETPVDSPVLPYVDAGLITVDGHDFVYVTNRDGGVAIQHHPGCTCWERVP